MTTEQALSILIAIITTLLGKWIWDRYLSQSSRVTAAMCAKEREACLNRIMAIVDRQDSKLSVEDVRFEEIHDDIKQIRTILSALLYTNIVLCQKMGIDCDEIAKLMVKQGIEV